MVMTLVYKHVCCYDIERIPVNMWLKINLILYVHTVVVASSTLYLVTNIL